MKEYHKPEVLNKLYHEIGMSMPQIGDKFGVDHTTIKYWMEKHDIPINSSGQRKTGKQKYHSAELLEELYHNQEMSTVEIADKFDVYHSTIQDWMKRNNIPTRPSTREKPPHLETDTRGYRRWRHEYNGKNDTVYVHRLLAVSEFGFDAVANMEIHHKNNCPLDNRLENIEVLSPSDHRRITVSNIPRDDEGNFL